MSGTASLLHGSVPAINKYNKMVKIFTQNKNKAHKITKITHLTLCPEHVKQLIEAGALSHTKLQKTATLHQLKSQTVATSL